MSIHFTSHTVHRDATDPVLPVEWMGRWLRESSDHGGRRLHAVAEVHRRLTGLGVTGAALVAGPWLAHESIRPEVWRQGPWPERAPPSEQLWAEGAGESPGAWLREVVDEFFADPERSTPPPSPRVYGVEGDGALCGLLVDPSIAGRRPGLVLIRHPPELGPAVAHLLQGRAAWWLVMMVAGLLRADSYRGHWDALAHLLVHRLPPEGGGPAERPVNAQEVVHRVAEVASHFVHSASQAFEAAAVAIFLPDPDEEYVYCLAAAGSELHAYDSMLVPGKPRVSGVGFGLTASYVVGTAYDPRGSPVLVRVLRSRDELRTRYRDLGFDDEALADDGARNELSGPFLAERFLAPEVREAACRGPWVFTAQRLPTFLSPSGRNLVVRYQGRSLSQRWATPDELLWTSRDRRSRMASLAMRIHADICGQLAEGLGQWREGLRAEILRELTGSRRWSAICQTLSSWLSARAVSVFRCHRGELSLLSWSLPRPSPELVFDLDEELQDSRELRLLQAPLYPRRQAISGEGFLGWPLLEDALARDMENVGTVPILASGQPVGLLRVDAAMSLFGGHTRRSSPQGGLHHHRPTVTPAHLRPVLEEIAPLLALALDRPGSSAAGWSGWSRWVDQARRGRIPAEEVIAKVHSLRAAAPSRSHAARLVGVHRNTLRRQLASLAEVIGEDAW